MAPTVRSMNNVLEISGLYKSYDDNTHTLKNIHLSMEEGGFLILVGPSGCGKSTLLNCIAGLEPTTSGSISISNRDVTKVEPKDRDIAMVFQSYALYPTMTIKDNIAFGMKIRSIPQEEQEAKIAEVSTLLKIEHLLERKPGQLSGGQRQRVAIGRALVRHPSLYLFDEPLSNLDAKLRVEMRSELKALHEKTQSSFIYVTHDQVEAMTMGTQIAVLNGGIIQQIGSPDEIYHEPANVFVASFMGSPPMNIMTGTFRKQGSNAWVKVIGQQEQQLQVPEYSHCQLSDGDEVLIGIRPEHFTLENTGDLLALIPSQIESTGADQFVRLPISEGNHITVRLTDAPHIEVNQPINLFVKANRIRLFDPKTEQAIPRD